MAASALVEQLEAAASFLTQLEKGRGGHVTARAHMQKQSDGDRWAEVKRWQSLGKAGGDGDRGGVAMAIAREGEEEDDEQAALT
eukprot:6191785-Pyramimonas_sp.AAC.1